VGEVASSNLVVPIIIFSNLAQNNLGQFGKAAHYFVDDPFVRRVVNPFRGRVVPAMVR
jgi:hypothetical protein